MVIDDADDDADADDDDDDIINNCQKLSDIVKNCQKLSKIIRMAKFLTSGAQLETMKSDDFTSEESKQSV